ncbi:MAG: cytochrome C [Gammaproteobacteria bacterium]|nr:cytochrome C [Gammaproteobacteria bacterium]
MKCHDKVAEDIDRGAGYHGRSPQLAATECRHCHTEHIGRQADIVGLVKQAFDHMTTDFELKGAHVSIACGSCHDSGKKFRDTPSECIACHRSNDKHKGRLGELCTDCHSDRSWTEALYDHSKTNYPLEQGHRDVACNACHPNQRYKDTPQDCRSCHRLNDSHGGHFGDRCNTCHSPLEWKPSSFNHNKETKFRLNGRHRKTGCNTCHEKPLYEKKLGVGCVDCHGNEDVHKGRNGPDCRKCHTTSNWIESTFSHDKDTEFPLLGRHSNLICESCHRGKSHEQELAHECYACHRQDDVHKGQEGEQCQQCHNEEGWGKRVAFDHDLADFPLVGIHAIAACESCHLTSAYKDTPKQCNECHGEDDHHEGTLGNNCKQCHNPNDWRLWQFDHDSRTEYTLDGAHYGLVCRACHREPMNKTPDLPRDCIDCHSKDDSHRGNFGKLCNRCHITESFRQFRIKN